MADPVLLARGLTVGREATPLISSLNLELGHGELMVVLGPNGSGKSTLLRTLTGILRPLQGSVKVCGKELATISMRERSRMISWVPQEEFIDFGWRVREFVALGRVAASDGIFESKDDEVAIERALTRCNALGLADRLVTELSGGERQRVRIARGLAQQSQLLVIDEPTSQLDVAHVISVLKLIAQLVTEGQTIIMTLHDLSQAISLDAVWSVICFGGLESYNSKTELINSGVLEKTYGVEFQIVNDRWLVPVTWADHTIG